MLGQKKWQRQCNKCVLPHCVWTYGLEKAIYKSNNKSEANKAFGEWLLLWCVDPDNVQMTVIHTLLVFVGVTRASLCTSLGPWWVTGRARLHFTLRGDACKVVHTARQMRTQRGCFKHPPLVHIFAWWGTWMGHRHCVFSLLAILLKVLWRFILQIGVSTGCHVCDSHLINWK